KGEIDERDVRRRHADGDAVELPFQLRQDQSDRLGGAGGRRDHRQRGGAAAAQVLVREVQDLLIVGVRVHRGHDAHGAAEAPMQKVASASFDGAEMMTVSTVLRRWRDALSFDVKRPDDSTTICAPRSGQGMSAGSGLAKTRSSLPSMTTPFGE